MNKKNDPAFLDNQKRYRQAMNILQDPEPVRIEDLQKREQNSMKKTKTMAVTAAAALICLFGATGAYAADLGGFRTMINGWLNGEQVEIEATPDGQGGYTFATSDGQEIGGGGGVEIDRFGHETPLPAQDVYETFAQSVQYKDGRIILTDHEKSADLTELFEKSDIVYVKMEVQGTMNYYQIQQNKEDGEVIGFEYSVYSEPFNSKKEADYVEVGK